MMPFFYIRQALFLALNLTTPPLGHGKYYQYQSRNTQKYKFQVFLQIKKLQHYGPALQDTPIMISGNMSLIKTYCKAQEELLLYENSSPDKVTSGCVPVVSKVGIQHTAFTPRQGDYLEGTEWLSTRLQFHCTFSVFMTINQVFASQYQEESMGTLRFSHETLTLALAKPNTCPHNKTVCGYNTVFICLALVSLFASCTAWRVVWFSACLGP